MSLLTTSLVEHQHDECYRVWRRQDWNGDGTHGRLKLVFISDDDRSQIVGGVNCGAPIATMPSGQEVSIYFRQSKFVGIWGSQPNSFSTTGFNLLTVCDRGPGE